MKEGLSLLYERNEPFAAEQAFRDVLKAEPTHYGAHFQLAQAIDREGRPADARPLWNEVLKSAQAINDTGTIRLVTERLASPDTVSQAGMMSSGVHALYALKDPATAEAQFRKVLEKNPTHYGATYQLASALDELGRKAEARPLWEKVLGMAITYKDAATEATARERLK
jgi:cytochrome c-type biogenesis protein CcmH/NrfG